MEKKAYFFSSAFQIYTYSRDSFAFVLIFISGDKRSIKRRNRNASKCLNHLHSFRCEHFSFYWFWRFVTTLQYQWQRWTWSFTYWKQIRSIFDLKQPRIVRLRTVPKNTGINTVDGFYDKDCLVRIANRLTAQWHHLKLRRERFFSRSKIVFGRQVQLAICRHNISKCPDFGTDDFYPLHFSCNPNRISSVKFPRLQLNELHRELGICPHKFWKSHLIEISSWKIGYRGMKFKKLKHIRPWNRLFLHCVPLRPVLASAFILLLFINSVQKFHTS